MMVILARSAFFSPMWTRLPGGSPALRDRRWAETEDVIAVLPPQSVESPDPTFVEEERPLFEPRLGCLPIDVLEEALDVIGPLEAVVNHEGMLEDVHDQDGLTAGRMARVVLVDPEVDEHAAGRVLVEDNPSSAPP